MIGDREFLAWVCQHIENEQKILPQTETIKRFRRVIDNMHDGDPVKLIDSFIIEREQIIKQLRAAEATTRRMAQHNEELKKQIQYLCTQSHRVTMQIIENESGNKDIDHG